MSEKKQTIFTTDDVRPAERYDFWHSVACRQILPHDSRPHDRTKFEALIKAGALADLGFLEWETTPIAVARSAKHIAQDQSNDLMFLRLVSGHCSPMKQNGAEVFLNAGDMALVDPRFPHESGFSIRSRLQCVTIPRQALESRIGVTPALMTRLIEPTLGDAGLLSRFLEGAPAHFGYMSSIGTAAIREHALDLIALSLGNLIGRPADLSSPARVATLRMRVFIDAHLEDPELDRQTIAGAVDLRVRQANDLLAREGTSITALLLERRLARVKRVLGDPIQAHRPIVDIASSCGFRDLTNFARYFKNAYGETPTEYRNAALQMAQNSEDGIANSHTAQEDDDSRPGRRSR